MDEKVQRLLSGPRPLQLLALNLLLAPNGAGGIRTPVTRKGKTVFKTVAISRSATAPGIAISLHTTASNGKKIEGLLTG
jgi:hypothetical protein